MNDSHSEQANTQQVYPPQNPEIFLHEYVLAGWGMPIGKSKGTFITCLTFKLSYQY